MGEVREEPTTGFGVELQLEKEMVGREKEQGCLDMREVVCGFPVLRERERAGKERWASCSYGMSHMAVNY